MIRAYDESYLDWAMKNLGEAFDYAVNACGIAMDRFAELFVSSGYAEQFQKGNPKYIVGLSGSELVMEILTKSGMTVSFPEPQTEYDCSTEYWCGWILAYYQWKSGRSFRDILDILPMGEIHRLYGTLHEASEDKFADVADTIRRKKQTGTNLQRQRKRAGYSQKKLAEKSGVNLRTLQQYELGTKQLRNAAAESVMALASVLGCDIEDILD
ncbi:MAG: helix-turn-helix transcriptional regulator [Erysipelotrichaceae bacterium]|nr:helix-turn-helix transcriptional regulator [Erysipelotrichaceae bacterium]